jgi:hypothetical protein
MSGELGQKLDVIIEESQKVREIAAIAERARRRLLVATLVVGVIGALLLAGVMWVGLANRQTVDTIVGCTTPGGECYDRGQARTGEIVQRIVDAQIATVECRNEVDVRACVEQKLSP